MKYLELHFQTTPCTEIVNDVLSAVLVDIGFDSFVESDTGIIAYIPAARFNKRTLEKVIANFPIEQTTIQYVCQKSEDKNWNEEWEKNFFQPIIIDDRCVVHSAFHKDIPKMEYDILIHPQMAFGTGHHETTNLIISELLNSDLTGKSVLDMGCGTSILAILARMRGAQSVVAIDIDTWCVDNSKENIALNNVSGITVELGDAGLLNSRGPFDMVIANINRNILLNDMKSYVARMNPGAELYMSGFYVEDVRTIKAEAESLGLTFDYYKEKNKWAVVKFGKY